MTSDQFGYAFAAALLASPLLLIGFIIAFFSVRRDRNKLRQTLADTALKLETSEADMKSGEEARQQLDADKSRLSARLAEIESRFASVLNLDDEARQVSERIENSNRELADLRQSYSEKHAIYSRLLHQIAIFDDRLSFAELGVYERHFDFSDSEAYKRQIEAIYAKQKAMISDKRAVVCPVEWQVGGSTKDGKTMVNRSIKLTLRAFNNECDAAIANTRWNNVNAMEKRIERAFQQINTLNESLQVSVTSDFLKLKLQELYLTHEYREKLKAEREERAEMARAQKEEMKLIRDMERAEEEEARYRKLLDKAKAEAEQAVGPKLDAFNAQIQMLEKDLADAHAKFQRAQAMAEKTRSGYVYIISNVGSFGEDMVKIGLTRRLDPTDRVRELGDASVPFVFDTHAIIYSEDAPTLERALHAEFEAVRVNAQNNRKEFFRAKLPDVEAAVKRLAPDAPFFRDVEAQEYRETLARRASKLAELTEATKAALPASI